MAGTKWNLEVENVQSCNCDYGCPCNFNGYPTHGNCEALVGYRVRKGKFGTTKLDGVAFALGAWWPKAIHEGNGIGRYYIDSSATAEQRTAVEEIFSGNHGGGFFEVFPKTWTKRLPTKVAKIEFHYDDHDSWFRVGGFGEVRSTHVKNPVTGDEFEGSITLPGGIAWRKAEVTSIKKWWMDDGNLKASHENVSGFVATIKFNETGVVG